MFGTGILCSEQFQESVLHFQHLFPTSLDIILQILYQTLLVAVLSLGFVPLFLHTRILSPHRVRLASYVRSLAMEFSKLVPAVNPAIAR